MDNLTASSISLIGTWRLISFVHEILATGEKFEIMGNRPNGYITFTPEGRVSVLITAEKRPYAPDQGRVPEAIQLGLYKTMMAYSGSYKLGPNFQCEFNIDCSWNELWVGKVLKRTYSIVDDHLSISLLPQIGIDGNMDAGVLTWIKVN